MLWVCSIITRNADCESYQARWCDNIYFLPTNKRVFYAYTLHTQGDMLLTCCVICLNFQREVYNAHADVCAYMNRPLGKNWLSMFTISRMTAYLKWNATKNVEQNRKIVTGSRNRLSWIVCTRSALTAKDRCGIQLICHCAIVFENGKWA